MSNKTNISGRRIGEARRAASMDQIDLCAALEVDYDIILPRSALSEIETGGRGVRDFELDAIARILDVDPVWLLRGED